MPKPELYPVKKLIRIDQATANAIEQFCASEVPPINQSEGIRRLLADQLIGLRLLENK